MKSDDQDIEVIQMRHDHPCKKTDETCPARV